MRKEKNKILLVVIFVIILFVGVLFFSNRIISQWFDARKLNISTVQPKLEVIDLADQQIYWFPVEFQNSPSLSTSYKSSALYNGSTNQFASFKVIVGTSEADVKAGECVYDPSKKQFTGNAKWSFEEVEPFIKKIKNGTKAILRFYIPKNQPNDQKEYYQQRVQYLQKLLNEIGQNQLNSEYLVVPDEICLASI